MPSVTDVIFAEFGIEIVKRDGALFIRYDAGHLAVQMREDEISETEAKQAMRGEKDAHQVLLAIERKLTESGVDPQLSNIGPHE